MLVNSTSTSDLRLLPNLSSSNSLLDLEMYCFRLVPGLVTFSSFLILSFLLILPPCFLILYHLLQQWWKTPSTSPAASSHSDCFTYHVVTMEIVSFFGCSLCFCGVLIIQFDLLTVGLFFFSLTSFGENFFHILTCLERYLAVIHPITYLSLRKERGIRIRNISIGCVWLLCVVLTSLQFGPDVFAVVNFCVLILSVAITSFFSLSVLCVLIGPGPGEQGGRRLKVDRPKQRAFYTIVSILGVLVLRFTCSLAWIVVLMFEGSLNCALITLELWFHLPSSLALPLLFLHRKGTFRSFQTCSKVNGK